MSAVWSFDVSYASHDDLKAGILARGTHRVVVLADTYNDALCAATQMVAATTDCQPTQALVRL